MAENTIIQSYFSLKIMMNQKSCLSLVERAVKDVKGFDDVVRKFNQHIILNGRSQSTYLNYIRQIASISLHFGRLPEELSEDDINGYLVGLTRTSNSPSRSCFKHVVFGLRYYFRMLKLNRRALALPVIKQESKLPIILNRQELRMLFNAPLLLKHRIVLSLIYSGGLRASEASNLKMGDVDFERFTIHVRQSKFKRDRILPLSPKMANELLIYINEVKPKVYLFNGANSSGRYSPKSISNAMRAAIKKTTITKDVNLHSLRHSYATHLLEDGLNIVTLKELLGHSEISTTMIYLHVAQCDSIKAYSPFDKLYA